MSGADDDDAKGEMIGREARKERPRQFCFLGQLQALGCLIKCFVWEHGVYGSGAVLQRPRQVCQGESRSMKKGRIRRFWLRPQLLRAWLT